MARWSTPVLFSVVVVVLAGAAWWSWPRGAAPSNAGIAAAAFAAAQGVDADGFAEVGADWDFAFPRDQGAHPEYRAEVWDLSGQVADGERRRFGLRLTLLRIGLVPPTSPPARASALAANAIMLGRFALAPETGPDIATAMRLSRAAAGLAGAETVPFRVWLEDWSLTQATGEDLLLTARTGALQLALALAPRKAAVTDAGGRLLDGAGGDGPGFHFYLLPRLAARGTLQLDADAAPIDVSGSVWLERAWGSMPGFFAGRRGQIALNRFTLQLDDDTELVCLHLRRQAGGGTPIPTCLVIAADGATRLYRRRELTLEPTGGDWSSPADGTSYPLHWRLRLPALDLDLTLRPLLAAQEVTWGSSAGERLWSGAVTVSSRGGGTVGGGRMDLSGYAKAPGT